MKNIDIYAAATGPLRYKIQEASLLIIKMKQKATPYLT